jgi:hypothetical protein
LQIDPGNSLRLKFADIGGRDRVEVILTRLRRVLEFKL